MVNFVIYETDTQMSDLYAKVIKKFLEGSTDNYTFNVFNRDDEESKRKRSSLRGPKVFLINLDAISYDALEVAREIRYDGDLESQIVLITRKDKASVIDELYGILYLDLVFYDERIIFYLMRCLRDAYRIVTKYKAFTFSSFDETFRLPYDDIYFIMKNMYSDTVTIFTKDDSFMNYMTIKRIEELLGDDPRFFKTSRSCILNLYNVVSYDKISNTVMFRNGMTINLVSRNKKSELEKRLKDFSGV